MTNKDIKIIMLEFGKKAINVKTDNPKKAKKMFDNMFNEKFK